MFTLPALPYAYNALEPYIDARTMEIHHTKHHNAYTTNLNAALAPAGVEGKSIEEIEQRCASQQRWWILQSQSFLGNNEPQWRWQTYWRTR